MSRGTPTYGKVPQVWKVGERISVTAEWLQIAGQNFPRYFGGGGGYFEFFAVFQNCIYLFHDLSRNSGLETLA
jgi:hypothetical protein